MTYLPAGSRVKYSGQWKIGSGWDLATVNPGSSLRQTFLPQIEKYLTDNYDLTVEQVQINAPTLGLGDTGVELDFLLNSDFNSEDDLRQSVDLAIQNIQAVAPDVTVDSSNIVSFKTPGAVVATNTGAPDNSGSSGTGTGANKPGSFNLWFLLFGDSAPSFGTKVVLAGVAVLILLLLLVFFLPGTAVAAARTVTGR